MSQPPPVPTSLHAERLVPAPPSGWRPRTTRRGSSRWWDVTAAALVGSLGAVAVAEQAWRGLGVAAVYSAVPWWIARRARRTWCWHEPGVGLLFEHPPLVRWWRPGRTTWLAADGFRIIGHAAGYFVEVLGVRRAPRAGVDRISISRFRAADRRRIVAWLEELEAGPESGISNDPIRLWARRRDQ